MLNCSMLTFEIIIETMRCDQKIETSQFANGQMWGGGECFDMNNEL